MRESSQRPVGPRVVTGTRWSCLVTLTALALCGCLASARDTRRAAASQADITRHVMRWLHEYQEAWNTGDAAGLGRMLGLNAAEVSDLRRVFEDRPQLRVIVTDVSIARIDDAHAHGTYVRTDRWIDRESKQPRYSTAAYEQTFHVVGGEVREISLRRR